MLVLALQVGTCLFKAWDMGGLCAPQQNALHRERMLGVVLSVWPRISEGHGHQVCHSVQKKLVWARLVSTGYEHVCQRTQGKIFFQVEGSSVQLMLNTLVFRQW